MSTKTDAAERAADALVEQVHRHPDLGIRERQTLARWSYNMKACLKAYGSACIEVGREQAESEVIVLSNPKPGAADIAYIEKFELDGSEQAASEDTELLAWQQNHHATVHCNFTNPAWTCTPTNAHGEDMEPSHGHTPQGAIRAARAKAAESGD